MTDIVKFSDLQYNSQIVLCAACTIPAKIRFKECQRYIPDLKKYYYYEIIKTLYALKLVTKAGVAKDFGKSICEGITCSQLYWENERR